jgi:hypothetical protein
MPRNNKKSVKSNEGQSAERAVPSFDERKSHEILFVG